MRPDGQQIIHQIYHKLLDMTIQALNSHLVKKIFNYLITKNFVKIILHGVALLRILHLIKSKDDH